jgi:hypothetical protein
MTHTFRPTANVGPACQTLKEGEGRRAGLALSAQVPGIVITTKRRAPERMSRAPRPFLNRSFGLRPATTPIARPNTQP